MKKHLNKIFYIILAVLISVSLVACNNNQTAVEQQPTPDPNVSTLPDLGKFVSVIPKSGDIDYSAGNEIAKQKIIEAIANEKNVQLDFEVIEISKDNFTNELNQLLSTATSIDSITADYESFKTYAGLQGLIKPVDSLINSHGTNLYNAIEESYWEDVKHNSQIYGVPSVPYPEKSMMIARSDMLYMFTTEPITSFNELLAILSFYKLMGYQYPLAVTWDQLIDIMATTFKVSANDYTHLEPSNAFIMREQSVLYIKLYLNAMIMLYENEYISPDTFTATPEQTKAEFMAGRAAVYVTEYDDLTTDRAMLKSTFPEAEMKVVSPLTSKHQDTAYLSGEEKIDNVLMFTGNSQHSEALMTFLDWSYTSQLNHTMVEMGAYGDQLMYNPALNEYEYVNGYSLSNKPFDGIYTLGLSTDLLYTPPKHVEYAEYTTDIIAYNSLLNEAHTYLTETAVDYPLVVPVSENGQLAINEYQYIMLQAAEKYIKGEINIDEYLQYERQMRDSGLLTTLAQEIGVAYLYELGALGE